MHSTRKKPVNNAVPQAALLKEAIEVVVDDVAVAVVVVEENHVERLVQIAALLAMLLMQEKLNACKLQKSAAAVQIISSLVRPTHVLKLLARRSLKRFASRTPVKAPARQNGSIRKLSKLSLVEHR